MVLQPLLLAAGHPSGPSPPQRSSQEPGLSVHLALWFTVFQREIPEHAQSRVSSYDALGSFVFMPLGYAVAGPVAVAIGTDETLVAAAAIETVCLAIILAIPSVWAIRAPAPAAAGSVELAAPPTERSA